MLETVISLFVKFPEMFAKAVLMTIFIAFLTVLFGTFFGGIWCYLRQSKFAPFRWVAIAYVEIIRGTPMLLQIMLVRFSLPEIGIDLSPFACVIVALIINSSAYVSELIRAGINAVDKGQAEAARSLGMSKTMTMVHIVLPQAIKNILPALGNEFIMIIKDSSLGSVYFVGELMTVQALIKGAMFLVIEPLIAIGIIYFILTFTLSKCVEAFERSLSKGD